ncbi:MAG TPA: RNA-binding protein [Methanoregulaceae archaeon]|nr:RNA-binding protein [Methanoregulaceae archaeon]HQJ88949.1 RNA-binding protein [Methanoregulaceae archaeon]
MAPITIRKRHTVRKGEAAEIVRRLGEELGEEAGIFAAGRIEVAETGGPIRLYLLDRRPLLFERDGVLFPTLQGAIARPFSARRVTVDMGAVPYVVNGADIMRPGIVAVTDDVRAAHPVLVVEERHGKPLAVCIARLDAEAMRAETAGKVCRNIHHVGDEIWSLEV